MERQIMQTNELPQKFNITIAKRKPQWISSGVFLFLLLIIISIHFISPDSQLGLFNIGILICFGFVVTLVTVQNLFTEQQIIELYDDRIVINGRNAGVINFADIKSYGTQRSKRNVILNITLNNGEEKELNARFGNGLDEFIRAFETKVEQEILEKHLSIKKDLDWPAIFTIAIVLIFLLLYLLGKLFS